jgi:hypothetical protein
MELARSTSRGGFSVRGIIIFVLTVIVAALLWTTLASSPTHAVDEPPKADWQGDSILYDGHQYYPIEDAKAGDSHGLTVGSHLYVHVEQISERPLVQKAHVIYFAPGSDPPALTSANFVTYDYSANRVYSNPQDKKTIVITPAGEESSYSACTVDGVGWFVCPVSVFLADSMDWLFDILSSLIAVQPPKTGDTRGDLFVAWNIMRSIANVAFIIVFMIIIYSQLTSLGISNYGLKKLIPRLIVAAILVNLSYYICAIAVDISNILGYSLQDLLKDLRDSTFNVDNDTWTADTTDWRAVLAFVLSGGTAGFLGIALSTAGSATSAIFLILPLLLGLILTALFVLLVLAARQAIIIILIVIAPIAFVAYLLPNTEKWFQKWRELFMTMLIFFPAFSLVFGGSQLAGGIIIQNATSIVTMIFGMAVQVAPLVITPLLLKLSGGLLGRIAGLVNDPRKGLLDRAKNWSKDRGEMYRQRSLRRGFRGNLFQAAARGMDTGNRAVKERTALYIAERDNRYNKTGRHRKIYEQTHGAESQKKLIEARLESNLKTKIRQTPHLLAEDMQVREAADQVTYAEDRLKDIYTGLQSGIDLTARDGRVGQFAQSKLRVQRLNTAMSATAISMQTSQRVQQKYLYNTLLTDEFTIEGKPIREWAGYPDPENGADSALTYAVNLKREAEGKLVAERQQLIEHFKMTGEQRQSLNEGNDVPVVDDDGFTYTFKASDPYARDAAYDSIVKTGSMVEILRTMAVSGTTGRDWRDTIMKGIPNYGIGAKASFMTGKYVDAVGKGLVSGLDNEDQAENGEMVDRFGNVMHNNTWWAAQTILEGKLKPDVLAGNDPDALKVFRAAAVDAGEAVRLGYIPAEKQAEYAQSLRAFRMAAFRIIEDPKSELYNSANINAIPILRDIAGDLAADLPRDDI